MYGTVPYLTTKPASFYQVGYWFHLINASICGVAAQTDTQFSFFDSFASKKQYLIFHDNSIRTFSATSLKYASPAKWSQRRHFQHRAGCKASQK